MRTKVCAAVLSLLLGVTPCGFARSKSKGGGSGASEAVGAIRLISVAESAYFQGHGRYATFSELIQSGQIQRTSIQSSEYSRALQLLQLQSDSQPVRGFTLNLTVSASGTGYHLYLTQKGEKCGSGWFTDESGILYGGKAVNCAEHVTTSRLKSWTPLDIDSAVPPARNDSPCPLPQILHEASERATELVDNLQRFTATEEIEHTEFKKNGKPRNSTNELVSYVAQIEQGSAGAFWVEEYRSAIKGLAGPPLSDTGTAAFALIFHPNKIENFEFRCEGQTDFKGTPAWQLRFEETADPNKSFHQIRIDRSVYQLRFKGRAWIAADNYQVLRLQTDLVAPIPKISLQLEHLDIAYAPVEFEKCKFRLWLPETASLHISYRGHRYQRVHTFSHFQLFLIDTEQKVKEPAPNPSGE